MPNKPQKCPICQNTKDNKLIFTEKAETNISDLHAHPEDYFKQMRCSSCKVLFVDSKIDEQFINDKFQLQYCDNVEEVVSMVDNYELRRLQSLISNLRKISTHISGISAKPRVLDVGCSLGIFLLCCKKLGWTPYGVELHPAFFIVAKKIFGKSIFHGSFLDINFGDKKFDVITFFEVLEHTTLPLKTLKKAKKLLTDDGVIVISVPTSGNTYLKYVLYKLINNKPGNLFYRQRVAIHGHIFNFSSQSVLKLAKDLDLDLVRLECIQKDGSSFIHKFHQIIADLTLKISSGRITIGHTLFFILKKPKVLSDNV